MPSDLPHTAPDHLTPTICNSRLLLRSETPHYEGAAAMPLPIEHGKLQATSPQSGESMRGTKPDVYTFASSPVLQNPSWIL